MKLFRLHAVCLLVAVTGLPLSVMAADAEYDCHVILDNNSAQIVFVEAPDRVRAEGVASRVRIKLEKARTVGVKQVRQCALRQSETLADPAMEVQRKSKPR